MVRCAKIHSDLRLSVFLHAGGHALQITAGIAAYL